MFFQVREKSGNFVNGQEKFLKDFESQEKSGNLKTNGYGRFQKIFLLFKRGKDVLSHAIVEAHLPPHWGLLLKERICSPNSSFKSNPQF